MKDIFEFDPTKKVYREEVGDLSEAAQTLRDSLSDESEGLFAVFIHICERGKEFNIDTMYPVKLCKTIFEAIGYAENEIREFYTYGYDENEIEVRDWHFLADDTCIEKIIGTSDIINRICIMYCPIA